MTDDPQQYTVRPLFEDDELVDLELVWPTKSWRLLGRGGPVRELDLAGQWQEDTLPVLIGSGLGLTLARLLEKLGPEQSVAVVDSEEAILEQNGVKEKYGNDPRILWLHENNLDQALEELSRWQANNKKRPFQLLVNVPFSLS